MFSDGVPERDYPEGCQLAVLCYGEQANDWYRKTVGARQCRAPTVPRRPVYFAAVGSCPHHHIVGKTFCRGHTSFSVPPSYNRPFFMT